MDRSTCKYTLSPRARTKLYLHDHHDRHDHHNHHDQLENESQSKSKSGIPNGSMELMPFSLSVFREWMKRCSFDSSDLGLQISKINSS